MKRSATFFSIVTASLLATSTTSAFVPLWNNDQHLPISDDLAINDGDFPENRVFHEAIEDATDFLNKVAGTNYDLDHKNYNENGFAITFFPNFRNEVHRGNLPDGVMGRATQTAIGGHTDECDIKINDDPRRNDGSNLNWSAIAPSPTNRVPLPLVFAHELGHCAGMDHNDNRANTMFSTFAVGDEGPWIGVNFEPDPSEDERDWMRHIHPDASTSHNLALTTWVCCSAGAPTNFSTQLNIIGDIHQVIFSIGYLNLGTFNESNVKVDYRIVPENNPVWSAGTFVDSTTIGTINSNVPFEFSKILEFNHPGDQCYHIGAFIDSDSAIAEGNESNNKVITEWTVCP